MTLMWFLYGAAVADNILHITIVFSVVSSLVTVGLFATMSDESNDKTLALQFKWFVRMVITASITIFLTVVIPCSKTIYMMAAAYYGEQVISDPNVKKIEDKIFSVLDVRLDELLPKPEKIKEK